MRTIRDVLRLSAGGMSKRKIAISLSVQLAILAVQHALPTIYPFPENAVAGGLISYGPDTVDTNRQVGITSAASSRVKSPPPAAAARRERELCGS